MRKLKKKSLLERQSIASAKKNKKKVRLLRLVFLITAVVALTLVGKSFLESQQKATKSVEKRLFFSIKFEDDQKENLSLKNKVYASLKKQLSQKQISLKSVARKTKEGFSLDWVHLIKISQDHYQVFIKRRLPAMILEAGMRCLVSHSKLVYDCSKKLNQADYKSLPILKAKNRKQVTNAVISTALEVLKSSKSNHYDIEYIEAKLPRGFLIKLKNQSFMLFVGLSNFDKKFKRLSELVLKQKKIMPQIGLIELDYNDKAILKKRL